MYTKEYSAEDKEEMRQAIKLSDTYLKVSEIFATIQGEGANTGIPSIFIRLQFCNLTCNWCDTPFTWDWEGTHTKRSVKDYEQVKYDPRKEIIEMTPEDILNKVKELAKYNIKHIILTGGEPLLQQKSKAFLKMLEYLIANHFKIEIETNGTLIPLPEVDECIVKYNVAPKLANSKCKLSNRRRDKAYNFFTSKINASFKFVVCDESDLQEIKFLQDRYKISPDKILLMPEGKTEDETKIRAQTIVGLCINNGYRFCNRLQVWIWDGAVRGV